MKKKTLFTKSLISFLLCAVMVLTCMTMAVSAAKIANTLYYDANGGEGGPSSNYTGGVTITVQSNEPTRQGYDFVGWNTKADGTGEDYDGGDSYTFTEDDGNGGCKVTLYAQWIKLYDVYVGGVQVTETNKDDVLGDGKVSYNAETGTLILNGANITTGYEYSTEFLVGIYADGDLTIELIGAENTVTVPDTARYSVGIYVYGNLNFKGSGAITINAGNATSSNVTAASIGIYTYGWLNITSAKVSANAGNAVANGENLAQSLGAYVRGSLDIDFEGCLTAKSKKAQGYEANSFGIIANGSLDVQINVSVYSGCLIAEGGEAVGVNSAGCGGVNIGSGGLYLYNADSDVKISAGKASATSEDDANAHAYSIGLLVYGGDVGIKAGKLEVSGGSYSAPKGTDYAVYLQKYELQDEEGNPYSVGGNFTVECDQVMLEKDKFDLFGTTVTINSQNGNAICAEGGIEISDKLTVSLPENGKVGTIDGATEPENFTSAVYGTILDSNGKKAQNVIVELPVCKVSLMGLNNSMAVQVPAGDSVNKTYCEAFEIDDFSELLETDKDGYTFGGWYTDEACTDGNEFSFDDVVDDDITLYAKWVSAGAGNDTGNSDEASPNTGDGSNISVVFVLMFASLAVMVVTLLYAKRKRSA